MLKSSGAWQNRSWSVIKGHPGQVSMALCGLKNTQVVIRLVCTPGLCSWSVSFLCSWKPCNKLIRLISAKVHSFTKWLTCIPRHPPAALCLVSFCFLCRRYFWDQDSSLINTNIHLLPLMLYFLVKLRNRNIVLRMKYSYSEIWVFWHIALDHVTVL